LCDTGPERRTTAIPLEPKGVEQATIVPIFLDGVSPRSSLFVNYFLLSNLHKIKTQIIKI
jgi:hypothetical protein